MERVELPKAVLDELRDLLQDAEKLVLSFFDSESFRNVVPLFLEEIEEVKEGDGVVEAKGVAGSFKAYEAGPKTLIIAKREKVVEIAVVDVPFESMVKFLKGEEEYEADEGLCTSFEAEEEEEEAEPES